MDELEVPQYIISGEVLQAIGEYLSTKPWKEVCQVMPILQSLERYHPKAVDKPTLEKD